MPEEQSAAEIRNGLSKEQKIIFVLLLIFSIVGLTLGFLELRNTVFGPFALDNSIPATLKEEVNSVDALKLRDTDGDGLSDYDESYVYYTNPYNADTYSYGNGITDKMVVEKGLARCANGGQNCMDESTSLGSTSTIPLAPPPEAPAMDISALLGDPQQVRALLVKSGMEQSALDKVSDKELMAMVEQLMASTSTIVVTSTTSTLR